MTRNGWITFWIALCLLLGTTTTSAADLAQTIERIKPAIVGIGTYQKTRSPPIWFRGTGFAVAGGRLVVTSAHVVPTLDVANKESLIIILQNGTEVRGQNVEVVAMDVEHDVVVLRVSGAPLPAFMTIGDSDGVREGQSFAFTGFPLGMALGFRPVTHRGIVSSITPVALPAFNTKQLGQKAVANLRAPYPVFQLDATAYPGNSGSPLFDQETGTVYGIINLAFVKGARENALSQPSGISYAIPAKHIQRLLAEKKLVE